MFLDDKWYIFGFIMVVIFLNVFSK